MEALINTVSQYIHCITIYNIQYTFEGLDICSNTQLTSLLWVLLGSYSPIVVFGLQPLSSVFTFNLQMVTYLPKSHYILVVIIGQHACRKMSIYKSACQFQHIYAKHFVYLGCNLQIWHPRLPFHGSNLVHLHLTTSVLYWPWPYMHAMKWQAVKTSFFSPKHFYY